MRKDRDPEMEKFEDEMRERDKEAKADRDKTECKFGCIFDGDRLSGDCRIPWSSECRLNLIKHIREGKKENKD